MQRGVSFKKKVFGSFRRNLRSFKINFLDRTLGRTFQAGVQTELQNFGSFRRNLRDRTLERRFWYHRWEFLLVDSRGKITTNTLEFFEADKITTNFLKILRDKKEEIFIKEFSKSSKTFSQIKKRLSQMVRNKNKLVFRKKLLIFLNYLHKRTSMLWSLFHYYQSFLYVLFLCLVCNIFVVSTM